MESLGTALPRVGSRREPTADASDGNLWGDQLSAG
jgi:hypothetical protein